MEFGFFAAVVLHFGLVIQNILLAATRQYPEMFGIAALQLLLVIWQGLRAERSMPDPVATSRWGADHAEM